MTITVARRCAEQGLTRVEAAKVLGLPYMTFYKRIRAAGINHLFDRAGREAKRRNTAQRMKRLARERREKINM